MRFVMQNSFVGGRQLSAPSSPTEEGGEPGGTASMTVYALTAPGEVVTGAAGAYSIEAVNLLERTDNGTLQRGAYTGRILMLGGISDITATNAQAFNAVSAIALGTAEIGTPVAP